MRPMRAIGLIILLLTSASAAAAACASRHPRLGKSRFHPCRARPQRAGVLYGLLPRQPGPRRHRFRAHRGRRFAHQGPRRLGRREVGTTRRARPRGPAHRARRECEGRSKGLPDAAQRNLRSSPRRGPRARPGRGGGACRGAQAGQGRGRRRAARPRDRDRRRPRRRGPGRDRQGRHAREERHAGGRAQARRADQCRAGHARGADAHRRLFRAIPRAHPARARAAGGPVRVDPRGRVHGPLGARLLGLRALDAPREQRSRALAGRAGERGRPDRRRVAARQEQRAAIGAARPVAERGDQREPRGRRARARRARPRGPAARRATCSTRASSC